MDSIAHQNSAGSTTVQLIFFFLFAVFWTTCVLFLAVAFSTSGDPKLYHYFFTTQTFIWCFAMSAVLIGLCSLGKALELHGGGKVVARACGGSPLKEPLNAQEKQLLEIVSELSHACKVKQPDLYVIRNELGINSFVAGHNEDDTVLAVTKGALDMLSRDELKGVIAHEFGHIMNADVKLSTQLIAIVFGVSAAAMLGRHFMRVQGFGRYVGIIMLCGGWLGIVCAQAIQASVSRHRELLADASAVQLTNSPDGIAGALKKIGANMRGSSLNSEYASSLNHVMLADCRDPGSHEGWSPTATAIRRGALSILASHPPLLERIRVLDPKFDGDFRRVARGTGGA